MSSERRAKPRRGVETALILALLLAAPALAQAPQPNPYSDRLARLSDIQRRAALRRAILDSGESCKTVTAAARQGPYRNLVMWTARCTRLTYGVFIGPDGTVQVRPCADLPKLRLPVCRAIR